MENIDLKNTYNKIADDWHKDHEADIWWQEGTNKFVSFLKKGDSVLDVGCAGGTKSDYLIKKGLKVLGIDFSEKLIEIAKKEVPKGEFLVMDLNDIDRLEGVFDGIFMQAILLHIPKKEVEDILKKTVQKLNPGGYLYIAVKEKIEDGPEEENRIDNDYGYEYERFFSYFTLDEFKTYFKNIGIDMLYKDIEPPSRTKRKSNWMQIIGKK